MGKVAFGNCLVQVGNNTGIEVPEEKLPELNRGKKAGTAKVNGYEYRNAVAAMNGKFYIFFSSEHRRKSGLWGVVMPFVLSLNWSPSPDVGIT